MSDQAAPQSAAVFSEDRTLPIVVYALYLLGFTNGITFLIGLVVAYANRDSAGPAVRSHYTFQIRSFWLAIAWCMIGVALVVVGIPLSLVLVGIPVVMLGGLICGAVGLWFAIRSIVGLVILSRGDAYPRPTSWLI